MHVNVHHEIATRAKGVIESQAIPLKVVAERSGLSTGWISGILRGQNVNPRVGNVWALAGALNVDPHWLMGLDTQ